MLTEINGRYIKKLYGLVSFLKNLGDLVRVILFWEDEIMRPGPKVILASCDGWK